VIYHALLLGQAFDHSLVVCSSHMAWCNLRDALRHRLWLYLQRLVLKAIVHFPERVIWVATSRAISPRPLGRIHD